MAIRIIDTPLTDSSIVVVELDTQTDWLDFAIANEDALIEQYGSSAEAFRHLCDGGLMMGGGAAPDISVYFAEE